MWLKSKQVGPAWSHGRDGWMVGSFLPEGNQNLGWSPVNGLDHFLRTPSQWPNEKLISINVGQR